MLITTDSNTGGALVRRLCWFVGLWLAGVLSIGALGLVIRWVLHP